MEDTKGYVTSIETTPVNWAISVMSKTVSGCTERQHCLPQKLSYDVFVFGKSPGRTVLDSGTLLLTHATNSG
jgi:hypothetical protein